MSVIFHLEILSVVYQCFDKVNPSCLADYFKAISSVRPYSTRQSFYQDLFVNAVQTTEYGIRSLHYTGSKLWNSLPNHKQITPFYKFRQNIKTSMIDRLLDLTRPCNKNSFPLSLGLQTNVLYKIPCADCFWSYIGETGKCFSTRKKEHIRNVKYVNLALILQRTLGVTITLSTVNIKISGISRSTFLKFFRFVKVQHSLLLVEIRQSI